MLSQAEQCDVELIDHAVAMQKELEQRSTEIDQQRYLSQSFLLMICLDLLYALKL